MAPTKYQFVINMRTQEGYVESGRFFVGNNIANTIAIFEQLQGSKNNNHQIPLLRLDLIKSGNGNGLDTILEVLDCTLDELSENVKTITKETFRLLNLETGYF
jgi:hypothetical protein